MAGYEVGSAYLSILPSTRGFANLLGNELSGPFSQVGAAGGARMGNAMATGGQPAFRTGGAGLAAIFMAGFAAVGAAQMVQAVTGWLSTALDSASDLAETQNKVNEIFGESSDTVRAFAENAVESLGQSQQTALDGAATFGIFGQSAGLAGDELAGFSTEMVTLATDLASFNNTSPEEAIQAIGAALRGESEPIRRYGVLLDDAALRARALELGIYNGTGALTGQQRVLAAQAEILAQTNTQQGDFARTADGYANQQRIFNAEMENFQATVGTALLPVVTDLFGLFRDVGMPILETVSQWFKDNPETIRTFVLAIVTGSLNVIDGFLAMAENMNRFALFFVSVVQTITNGFMWFVGTFLAGAETAFGWIPGVGDDLKGASDDFTEFAQGVNAKFEEVSGAEEQWIAFLEGSRTAVHDLQDAVSELNGATATITITADMDPNLRYANLDALYAQNAQRRATGGPVVAGQPYVVGEESWELFVPDTSGSILNPAQVAKALGGSGVGGNTVNVYPGPGMSEEAIGMVVAERFNREMAR